MKYLLIFTIWNSAPYSFDAIKYEVKDTTECQKMGSSLAKDLLSRIPGITSVHYECVKKEYGE
jgi:hypothetical protein